MVTHSQSALSPHGNGVFLVRGRPCKLRACRRVYYPWSVSDITRFEPLFVFYTRDYPILRRQHCHGFIELDLCYTALCSYPLKRCGHQAVGT